MKVCVVGSGAREHALAVALGRTASVVVAPGNPGIRALTPAIGCSGAPPEQIDADLFVIGPEVPLVGGLADRLRGRGRLVFGPGADGAQVEGSKAWMKALLVTAGVPTAAHGTFESEGPAVAFLRHLRSVSGGPYVVKTDGLAAGKGVLVTESIDEAIDDVRAKLSGTSFGEAGRRVVIEEGLVGDELSVMAICDGHQAVALAGAQDFKRIGEGDIGPNTGGMGAFSPVPGAGQSLVESVMDRAVLPTLAALRREGIDYRGVLYAGIMLTAEGPKVLEFNVRFGDPEAQVVLPRWRGDVTAVLAAAAAGSLAAAAPPDFSDQAAVCVVLAAGGYPTEPRTGDVITGVEAAAAVEGVQLYAAAVARGPNGSSAGSSSTGPGFATSGSYGGGSYGGGSSGGNRGGGGLGGGGLGGGAPNGSGSISGGSPGGNRGGGGPGGGGSSHPLTTNGGRVLSVSAVGQTLGQARDRAYAAVAQLDWPGRQYRGDIARRSVDGYQVGRTEARIRQ